MKIARFTGTINISFDVEIGITEKRKREIEEFTLDDLREYVSERLHENDLNWDEYDIEVYGFTFDGEDVF